jgi:hypothetical protein
MVLPQFLMQRNGILVMNTKKTCGIIMGVLGDGMGIVYQNGIPPQKMET